MLIFPVKVSLTRQMYGGRADRSPAEVTVAPEQGKEVSNKGYHQRYFTAVFRKGRSKKAAGIAVIVQ